MKDYPRTILCLGLLFLAPARGSAESIPGATSSVETLSAGLNWTFSISKEPTTQKVQGRKKTVWRFKSEKPYSVTNGERLFLRFSFSIYRFEEVRAATDQLAEWKKQGEHPTGLTYAWVRIIRRDRTLYRLDIPCTFSEANVEKITSNLTDAIFADGQESLPAISCRCGGSCVGGGGNHKP